MIADLAFWYGIGLDEFGGLPFNVIDIYIDRLPARKAELEMILASAAGAPYMERADRAQYFRKLESLAYGQRIIKKKVSRRRLSRIGIGIRIPVKDVSTETPVEDDKGI